jgi:hypothetical protein
MASRLIGVNEVLNVTVRRPPDLEGPVGHDVRFRLGSQSGGITEVIRVRVSNQNRVDPTKWDPGRLQAGPQSPPRRSSRKTGIDYGRTLAVFEHIHVGMSETGEVDRQLNPENARCHLGHFIRRWRGLLPHQ